MIYRPATTQPIKDSLLFVHGMCHGAWCWDTGFMEDFAKRGYDCYAMDLMRGKGPGPATLSDFVDQLQQTISELHSDPILIGHSMGGYIIQRYLEERPARKVVLLASVPPKGALLPALRFLRNFPSEVYNLLRANLQQALTNRRRVLYHPQTDQSLIDRRTEQMTQESFPAFLNMVFRRVRNPKQPSAKTLVVGSYYDGLISVSEVYATAARYDTSAIILSEVGHNMMLEPQAAQVSELILDWLEG
ncbi:MAG: alpha/beta hydrolase [Bacteroidota bacterium]